MVAWNDDETGASGEAERLPTNRHPGRDKEDAPELTDEHGIEPPSVLKSIPLEDIDDQDITFQFRFSSESKSLLARLKREGQIEPIKVMPGKTAYRILDGFRRTRSAKKLGWKEIKALVYPVMDDRTAKRIAIVSNVSQETLAPREIANAIHHARKDGRPVSNIAEISGLSIRQVERYLVIPQGILPFIGKRFTITHATVIGELGDRIPRVELEDLVSRIRDKHISVRELRELLKFKGMTEKRGRTRSYGTIQKKFVRVYDIKLGPNSPADELKAAARFLRKAAARLDSLADGAAQSEN